MVLQISMNVTNIQTTVITMLHVLTQTVATLVLVIQDISEMAEQTVNDQSEVSNIEIECL